jgi:nitrate/nitrite-specific signal transduction histidine kinase
MSGDEHVFSRAEEFLGIFKRGAEFSRELLVENERLRSELMRLQDRQQTAATSPEQWSKLRHELLERIHTLEEECTSMRGRLADVEEENGQFARRYVEIEEENNNLANLYVASYQLHSTLDMVEVLQIITEIVINLIGAEVFAIYLLDEATDELGAIAAEGMPASRFPTGRLGRGELGEAVASLETTCRDGTHSDDLERPLVCVPLVVQERPLGAIAIYRLLQQKEGVTTLDRELFNLLGCLAATAIFAARLYSQSDRKPNTIRGFIDLLASSAESPGDM